MDDQNRMTRRRLLQLGGLTIAGWVVAACSPGVQSSGGTTGQNQNAPGVESGGAVPAVPAAPGQVAVTSNADFYTVAIGATPGVPDGWKLEVAGNLARPASLGLNDLKQFPVVEEMRTLECISNPAGGPLISNANWKGLRMADLLNRVGVGADTLEIQLESFDGFHTSIPLDLAMDEHSLLVYEMNGAPLPPDHGQPLRCLWPGRYGMKQPKWLKKVTAIMSHHTGYWEGQGWSNEARIKPSSRIDLPREGDALNSPRLDMQGIGFSGADGVAKIEVSVDGGKTWKEAQLVRGPTPYVWTNWSSNQSAVTAGQYTLLARVTDKAGQTQQQGQFSLLGGTFPDGTSDIQPVVVTVNS